MAQTRGLSSRSVLRNLILDIRIIEPLPGPHKYMKYATTNGPKGNSSTYFWGPGKVGDLFSI